MITDRMNIDSWKQTMIESVNDMIDLEKLMGHNKKEAFKNVRKNSCASLAITEECFKLY